MSNEAGRKTVGLSTSSKMHGHLFEHADQSPFVALLAHPCCHSPRPPEHLLLFLNVSQSLLSPQSVLCTRKPFPLLWFHNWASEGEQAAALGEGILGSGMSCTNCPLSLPSSATPSNAMAPSPAQLLASEIWFLQGSRAGKENEITHTPSHPTYSS